MEAKILSVCCTSGEVVEIQLPTPTAEEIEFANQENIKQIKENILTKLEKLDMIVPRWLEDNLNMFTIHDKQLESINNIISEKNELRNQYNEI